MANALWCENKRCSDSNIWHVDPKASVLYHHTTAPTIRDTVMCGRSIYRRRTKLFVVIALYCNCCKPSDLVRNLRALPGIRANSSLRVRTTFSTYLSTSPTSYTMYFRDVGRHLEFMTSGWIWYSRKPERDAHLHPRSLKMNIKVSYMYYTLHVLV